MVTEAWMRALVTARTIGLLVATVVGGLVATSGCGYHAVAGGGGGERFAVVLATTQLPDAVASDEVVAGVRDELARTSSLSAGTGYPRCEVEVLRADEASEGIAAAPSPVPGGPLLPSARATRVGIVARAWIVRSKDGGRERDTGDVRAVEVVSAAEDARTATFRHDDALRAAGRRTGRRLGLRILGYPTASD